MPPVGQPSGFALQQPRGMVVSRAARSTARATIRSAHNCTTFNRQRRRCLYTDANTGYNPAWSSLLLVDAVYDSQLGRRQSDGGQRTAISKSWLPTRCTDFILTVLRNIDLLVVVLLTAGRLCGGVHVHFPSWRILQSRAHQKIDTTLTIERLQPYLRSQRAEDLTLHSKYFCQLTNGTYLELGALDGVKGSNSYLFEMALGWRGVLIEASPKSYESLVTNRPNSIALNAAVCESYEKVHYAMGGQHPAVHGILEFMSDKFKQAFHPQWREYNETDAPAVPCYPLESLLKLSGIMHFQFFSLDVEGAELQVLQSINFRSVTFDVILVEADGTNQRKDLAVRRFLQHHGYKFIEHVTHNDWFVRNDWTPSPC